MAFRQAVEGSSEVVNNSMAQQLLVAGSGWSEQGAMLVVTMSVSDPATYAAAFAEIIEGVENSGQADAGTISPIAGCQKLCRESVRPWPPFFYFATIDVGAG